MTLSTYISSLLDLLTPTGRELARRRRRADAEAAIAAERIEAARLLAGIAHCQLRLAELDRRAGDDHPGLARSDAVLRGTLTDLMQREVYRFYERTEES